MPILAHIFRIIKDRWLSSIILPIMCVDTNISFMIIFSVRAPYCFKVKKIEVHIWFKFFYQLYWKLLFTVGKWTKFSIFTFLQILQIWWAEFSFIFIRMIEFLNSVVSFITIVYIRTILMILNIPTFLRLIKS